MLSAAISQQPNLLALLQGEESIYQGEQPSPLITFFAPVNSAFQALPVALQNLLNQTSPRSTPGPEQQQQGGASGQQQPGAAQSQESSIIAASKNSSGLALGLLNYHIVNAPLNLSQSLNTSNYISVPTFLESFNLTIHNSGSINSSFIQEQQELQQQSQIPGVAQVNVTSIMVNDATVARGLRGVNGIVYVVDTVMSPLWYANVTLANLPNGFQLPQLAGAMTSGGA